MILPQRRRDAEKTGQEIIDKSRNFSQISFLRFKSLRLCVSAVIIFFAFSTAENSFAQTQKPKTQPPAKNSQTSVSNLPKVTQIDAEALKNLIKPNGKPLLINFWATWCDPCREEFPDLVKINADYRDKIDVIAISLDELSEINGDVPKFLAEMKATMPAYLLKTPDEEAAIAAVSKDWQGGLPFTILLNEKGETVYIKQGKFKPDFLRAEIEKLTNQTVQKTDAYQKHLVEVIDYFSDSDRNNFAFNMNFENVENLYEKGKQDAKVDVSNGKLVMVDFGLVSPQKMKWIETLKTKYGISVFSEGCIVSDKMSSYAQGYNEVSTSAIKKHFGNKVLEKAWKEIDKNNTTK